MPKSKNKVTELQTGHEVLSFPLDIKSIHEDEDEENEKGQFGFFEGFAATFSNIDLVNDRIEPGAFAKSLHDRPTMPLLFQHDFFGIIGTIVEAKENEDGLFVKGRVNLGTQQGKDAFALLKAGDLKTMSIGFNIIEKEFDKGIRVLKEIDLQEISIVTFPANPEAQVTGVKHLHDMADLGFAPLDTEWDAKMAVERLSEFKLNDEDYETAFMCHVEDEKGDNKVFDMPIADVIEGKLQIIPNAVFAIAEEFAINDFEGNSEEKTLFKNQLASYYEEMAKEFKDENIQPPWEKKTGESTEKEIDELESIKDVEQALKSKGFCKQEAKTLISKIKQFTSKRDVESELVESENERDVSLALDSIKDFINQLKKDRKNV